MASDPTRYITSVDAFGNVAALANGLYGTCATAAATAAKVATLAAFDGLVTGVTIKVKFTYSNTASNPTLNVNGTGAKPLCKYGTTKAGTTNRTSWNAGSIVSLTYDGTSWIIDSHIDDTGDTNTDTKVTQTATTTSNDYPILLKSTTNTNTETTTVRFGATSAKVPTINPATGNLKIFSVNDVMIQVENTTGVVIQNQNTGGKTYHLNDAASKAVDTSISAGSTSTNLPTSQAVADYVATQAAGAATFQGTLVQTDSGGSATKWTQAELAASSYKKGWYWVVEDAGTYAGEVMEVGDMLFCVSDKVGNTYADSDFTAIQNNIETLTTTEIDSLWAAA